MGATPENGAWETSGLKVRPNRRRVLRWGIAAALLVLFFGGVFAAQRLAAYEVYLAGLLEREIAAYTGLDAAVGALDLRFFPTPRATLANVRVEDGPFHAYTRSAIVRVDARALRRGRFEITGVDVDAVTVSLPADFVAMRARLDASLAIFRARQGDRAGGGRAAVDHVSIPEAAVYVDGERWAAGAITLRDLLSGLVTVECDLVAPVLGPDAAATVALRVATRRRTGGAPEVEGHVRVADAWPAHYFGMEERAPLRVHGEARVSGPPDALALDLSGDADWAGAAALRGAWRAEAWWWEGQAVLNGLRADFPGLTLRADVTAEPGAPRVAVSVPEASLTGAGLSALVAHASAAPEAWRVNEGARLDLRELLLGWHPETGWRFASGALRAEEIGVADAAGREVVADLSADARIEEDVLHLDSVRAGPHEFRGKLSRDGAAARLEGAGSLALDAALIAPWVDAENLPDFRGAARVDGLHAVFDPAAPGWPEALRARVALEDFSVTPPGRTAAIAPIHGALTLHDADIHVEEAHGPGFHLQGVVTAGSGASRVNLQGAVRLTSPLTAPWLDADFLDDVDGLLVIEELAGPLDDPAQWRVSARLEDGRAAWRHPGGVDHVTQGAARFESADGAFSIEATAHSAMAGPLQVRGESAGDWRDWQGSAAVDLGRVAREWARDSPGLAEAGPIFALYRDANFDWRLDWPADAAGAAGGLEWVRREAPGLDGKLRIVRGDAAVRAERATLRADLPLDAAAGLLPPALRAEHTARVTADYALEARTLDAEIDLDAAAFAYGPHLRKAAGQAMRLRLRGGRAAPEAPWDLHGARLSILGEHIDFERAGGAWRTPDFALDLAALAPLAPTAENAAGRVRGAMTFGPFHANLVFEEAAFSLAPGLAVERLHGEAAWSADRVRLRELAVHGAGFQGVIDAAFRDGAWEGGLRGGRLNLDALFAARAAFEELRGGGTDAGGGAANRWMQGALKASIGAVHWRAGRIDEVETTMTLTPDAVTFEPLRCRVGAGAAAGAMTLRPARPETLPHARLDLVLEDADLRVIDQLLLDPPRGVEGAVSGHADLAFSAGAEGAWRQNLTGEARLLMKDGNFGQIGFATRMLAALRGGEILRLRVPTFRDDGLTFQYALLDARFNGGAMEIKEFVLADRAYAMDAAGWADFKRERSDVLIRVHPLEAVTGLVDAVPLLSEAARVVRGATHVRLQATGSPFAPRIRPAPADGGRLRDGVDAVRGVGESVRDILGF